jgi:hypothetical protein
VYSVTVPVLSVVVVVVSVVPLGPVATVVEVEDVCPYATKPMRAMAEATLRNNFIVAFYFTKLLQWSQLKAIWFVPPNEFGEPGR